LLSDYVSVCSSVDSPSFLTLITFRISLFIQKIDALRWTSHMDECLQVLDEAKECLTDGILVQQVRLQLIAEKMAQGTWHDGALESTKHTSELPSLHFQSLHSQFQNIKIQILAGTQADGKML
jgi:hypothetical protein